MSMLPKIVYTFKAIQIKSQQYSSQSWKRRCKNSSGNRTDQKQPNLSWRINIKLEKSQFQILRHITGQWKSKQYETSTKTEITGIEQNRNSRSENTGLQSTNLQKENLKYPEKMFGLNKSCWDNWISGCRNKKQDHPTCHTV